MKALFWNVRGLGGKKRRGQLKELIDKYRVDIFCIQETMKKEFTIGELRKC
jgi:exonuclease III